MNEAHLTLARSEATAAVLLDELAAFNSIGLGMLLDCSSSWFGVGGIVMDWFKSYLSGCSQCIKIGSILSDAESSSIG